MIVRNRQLLALACGLIWTAGCRDTTAPDQKVSITPQAGDGQYSTSAGPLAEPLQVIVTDPVSKRAVRGITVQWRIAQGNGASVNPTTSVTADNGIATTSARLGTDLGTYVFEATAANLVGSAARFEARAVLPPQITSLAPRSANAGETVTIQGVNFSPNAGENIVLIGGMRALVTSATTTQLRAVIPACVPTRTVPVQAMLGAVSGAGDSIAVRGTTGTSLALARGATLVIRDAGDLACQRVLAQAGASYLLIPQNYSEVVATVTPFELIGLSSFPPVARPFIDIESPEAANDFGVRWETRLRMIEREFDEPIALPTISASYRIQPPEIGDKRTFKAFGKDDKFVSLSAVVKHISQRAIIYQDEKAPANGFTSADFELIGSTFDAPTYETDVAAFGSPSDIDANGKVIILLTPVVNELTAKNSSGYVAGFFFGCDLQTVKVCSGSNRGELFYLFVPDPTGIHGNTWSKSFVLNGVRPVLAHEFQHMINFAARQSLDALWLSEGIAHMAEDLVGEAYANLGQLANATLFRQQNYLRAGLFLRDPTITSLISESDIGSLEQRGASWLLVKYLMGHYGGTNLLKQLTQSTRSSVANVTAVTGQPWNTLLSDWAVALWADDSGIPVQAKHTFTNINLRTTAGLSSNGVYVLNPTRVTFADFAVRGTLPASTQRFVLMEAGSNPKNVSLALSGARGGPFAPNATVQATILRVQ